MLLALAANHNLELVQLDVKTVFLHGDLNEEIYMEQLEGYDVSGKEHLVCKLKRARIDLSSPQDCGTKILMLFGRLRGALEAMRILAFMRKNV